MKKWGGGNRIQFVVVEGRRFLFVCKQRIYFIQFYHNYFYIYLVCVKVIECASNLPCVFVFVFTSIVYR